MSKNYLKSLESESKRFRKANPGIIDIIIYGSSAAGKSLPRDLDIMLLFGDSGLDKRLKAAQEFRKGLKGRIENADIKSMNLADFFDRNFLARQGILLAGTSLITGERICEKMGFRGYSIFTYSLKNMTHNEKTKFNYALSGRLMPGVMKSLGGVPLGRGAARIPAASSVKFEEFLKGWKVDYRVEHCLVPFY